MLRRFMCWLGKCTRCRTYDTPEGIGGRCIDCGKIHGWVTRADLRRYADAEGQFRDWAALRGMDN